jgi:general secretion pathway protein N
MSAWRQPLIQVLAALALMLAATLGWLSTGVGSDPDWLAIQEADAPLTAVPVPLMPTPVPLEQLVDTWKSPLFSPTREPDKLARAVKAATDLGGLKLTGVIIDGSVRHALFKQADGRDLSLREGGQLPSGWRVQRIEAQAVQFELDGSTQRLQLPTPRLPEVKQPGAAPTNVPDAQSRRGTTTGGH